MSFTSQPRDIRVIAVARAASLLGDQAALIALTLRVSKDGPTAVTTLLVVGLVPLILLAPVSGRLADRVDHRILLAGTGLLQAVICFGLVDAHATPRTLALVGLLAAGQSVTVTTWQALIPTVVDRAALPAALALTQSAATGAVLLAPLLGGVLSTRYGTGLPLLIDACSYLALTGAAFAVRTRRRATPADHRPSGGGLALIRRDPVLPVLLGLLGLTIGVGGAVNVVEVFLIRVTFHAGGVWLGVLGTGWGLGMVAGSVLAGRRSGDATLARATVGALAGMGLALAGYSVAPTLGVIAGLAVVGGVMNGTLGVTCSALVMGRAPADARGRVAATVSAITAGAQVGAYLLGGVLASALAPRAIFALTGLLAVLGPLLFGRRLIRITRCPLAHSPVPEAPRPPSLTG